MVLAVKMFVPKFERSKTHKREREAEKDEKTAERKQRQIETRRAAQTKLQSAKDKKAAHKCKACGTGYKRESNLAGHACTPIADANSNDNDDGNKTGEPFKKSDSIPESTECNTPVPFMFDRLGILVKNKRNEAVDLFATRVVLHYIVYEKPKDVWSRR
jgi:hypothetical protein